MANPLDPDGAVRRGTQGPPCKSPNFGALAGFTHVHWCTSKRKYSLVSALHIKETRRARQINHKTGQIRQKPNRNPPQFQKCDKSPMENQAYHKNVINTKRKFSKIPKMT